MILTDTKRCLRDIITNLLPNAQKHKAALLLYVFLFIFKFKKALEKKCRNYF